MTWARAVEAVSDGRRVTGEKTEGVVRKVEDATGLKLGQVFGGGKAVAKKVEVAVAQKVEEVAEAAKEKAEAVKAEESAAAAPAAAPAAEDNAFEALLPPSHWQQPVRGSHFPGIPSSLTR